MNGEDRDAVAGCPATNLAECILSGTKAMPASEVRELAEMIRSTHEKAAMIREIVLRSASFVRQLLEFSQPHVVQTQALNLNRTVVGLTNLLRPMLGEEIECITHLDPDLGYIRADQSQIDQVLMNLVVNAREAMPHGGRLIIETRNTGSLPDGTHQSGILRGQWITLKVSDNGIGIDPESQAHIFDPFYTTKLPGIGAGWGLATAREIVNEHGGFICVESEPKKGASFTVYFPRLESCERPAASINLSSRPPNFRTVLVVEREPLLRKLTCEFLKKSGYIALEASSNAQALEISRRWGKPIALLIAEQFRDTDTDGPELGAILKKFHPAMSVLYTLDRPQNVRLYAAEPDIEFLLKPYTEEELGHKLLELLPQPGAPIMPSSEMGRAEERAGASSEVRSAAHVCVKRKGPGKYGDSHDEIGRLFGNRSRGR